MSILLLILAGVVIYYLYITLQDYLKNPVIINQKPAPEPMQEPESSPYTTQSPAQKLQNSYEGASVGMLGLMLQAGIRTGGQGASTADSSADSGADSGAGGFGALESSTAGISPLQAALIEDFIHALSLHNKPEYESDLRALLTHYAPAYKSQTLAKERNSSLDISELALLDTATLAGIFLDNTYGEYKKRLQFVGFLLMLAWSDKELNEKEQDIILDIAAFLEIDNDDFNALYDSFGALESSAMDSSPAAQASLEQALKECLSAQDSTTGAKCEQIFFSHVQKLCTSARKKDKPQAQSMPALWESEQIYTTILRTLIQSDNHKSTQDKKESKGESKTSGALDSPTSSALESTSPDSSTNAAPELKKSAQKSQTESKAESKADSAPSPKRDSSWDHI